MPPQDLDVNVHPTKKEVHFLHEEKLLELLHAELSSALRSSNDSRSFQVQTTLRFDQQPQSVVVAQSPHLGAPGITTTITNAAPARNLSNLTSLLASGVPSSSSSSSAVVVPASSGSSENRAFPTGREGGGSYAAAADVTATTLLSGTLYSKAGERRSTENPHLAAGAAGAACGVGDDDHKKEAEERFEQDEDDAEFDFTQVHNRHYLTARASTGRVACRSAPVLSATAKTQSTADIPPGLGEFEDDYDSDDDDDEEVVDDVPSVRPSISPKNGRLQTGSGFSNADRRGSVGNGTRPATGLAPKKMVRTDPSLVKIDAFFRPAPASSSFSSSSSSATGSMIAQPAFGPAEMGREPQNVCECDEPDLNLKQPVEDDSVTVFCQPSSSFTSAQVRIGSKRSLLGAMGDVPGAFAAGCLCCGKAPKRSKPSGQLDAVVNAPPSALHCKLDELVETSCEYVSVQALIWEIKSNRSAALEAMLRNHTYVGAVDCYFSLIQHGTRLMLLDHSHLLKDMYYQIALRRFAELDSWALEQPVDLGAFLDAALQSEHLAGRLDVPRTDITSLTIAAVNLLCSKAPLIREYFNITIDVESQTLTALPILVPGVKPLLHELPTFLLNLATHTNWDDESACFQTVALNLASYYAILDTEDAQTRQGFSLAESATAEAPFQQLTRESGDLLASVLYPAMRQYLLPHQQRSTDHSVIQVAALEQLYKVFERC